MFVSSDRLARCLHSADDDRQDAVPKHDVTVGETLAAPGPNAVSPRRIVVGGIVLAVD